MLRFFTLWFVAAFLLSAVVAPVKADTITVYGTSNVVDVSTSFTQADFGGMWGGTVPGGSFGTFVLDLSGAPFDPALGTLNSVTTEIFLINESSVGVEFLKYYPEFVYAEAAISVSTVVSSPLMYYPAGVSHNAIHCREPCLSMSYGQAYRLFEYAPPPGGLPASMEIDIGYSDFTVGINSVDTELASAGISISTWAGYNHTYDYTPASAVVPVPAAALLFLSGMGMFGFIAKKTGRKCNKID